MKGFRFVVPFVLILFVSQVAQPPDIQYVDKLVSDRMGDSPSVSGFTRSANFEDMNLSTVALSLSLNETDATILGNMTIDFFNSDSVAFSSIPFHLYLSGMFAQERLGYIDIHSVTAFTPSPIPLSYDVFSATQLMWVHLNEDLQPNTSVVLKIVFESVLPTNSSDRAGVSGSDIESSRMFEFASAYPIPCVYDEYDGWNTDPYLATGDPFYLDMAHYAFNLSIPNDMKIAATGELVGIDVGTTETTYRYIPSAPVREITFCASRYYIVESQLYNGVNVSSYYLPESAGLWSSNGLDWGVRAMALYNDTFGPYPYTTLNMVEDSGFYYGMEYPCQVYLSHIIYDRYELGYITPDTLDAVIAHEVAHQWWYQLVGNDEVDVGFLDEGLAVWSVYYYSEFYDLGWPGKEDDFYFVKMVYPAKINQSIYDNESTYYFTAYDKTPVVLERLRQIIGTDAFLDSIRLFFSRFSFRIAFLPDLQKAFEDHLNSDLDWFFIPMFDNAYLPNYSFQSVIYNKSGASLTITIEDLNEHLHVRNYKQNFSIEVQASALLLDWAGSRFISAEDFAFTDIQLFGTTEVVLYDLNFATYTPEIVTLQYDAYSLVQLDDPSVHYISTTDIKGIPTGPTSGTTSTTATTTQPTTPTTPTNWLPMSVYLIAAGTIGAIAVISVVVVLKKNRP
ncbi:MAG: M1 family metallopeptidase [Candidatus Thorarchaeota archaeon]